MTCMLRKVHQHANLAVGRILRADYEPNRDRRKLANQALDIASSGVIGMPNSKQDLELRVLLHGVRSDGFVESVICASHRFQDRNGGAWSNCKPLSTKGPNARRGGE